MSCHVCWPSCFPWRLQNFLHNKYQGNESPMTLCVQCEPSSTGSLVFYHLGEFTITLQGLKQHSVQSSWKIIIHHVESTSWSILHVFVIPIVQLNENVFRKKPLESCTIFCSIFVPENTSTPPKSKRVSRPQVCPFFRGSRSNGRYLTPRDGRIVIRPQRIQRRGVVVFQGNHKRGRSFMKFLFPPFEKETGCLRKKEYMEKCEHPLYETRNFLLLVSPFRNEFCGWTCWISQMFGPACTKVEVFGPWFLCAHFSVGLTLKISYPLLVRGVDLNNTIPLRFFRYFLEASQRKFFFVGKKSALQIKHHGNSRSQFMQSSCS